ncbi:hypothetical protein V1477_016313 [Vespula maculifrons]|uniref:Uncharacterized protein n=1 Tax=Vespula maculifrons TaxID=7453 RepID=A0ABD2BCN5_VESMC
MQYIQFTFCFLDAYYSHVFLWKVFALILNQLRECWIMESGLNTSSYFNYKDNCNRRIGRSEKNSSCKIGDGSTKGVTFLYNNTGSSENGEIGSFQYQYFAINVLLNPPGEGKNIFPGRHYFGSFFPTADILRKLSLRPAKWVCLKMDEIGVPREKVAEVINDYQSTASTWVSSRMGVRRVRTASTRESEEGGGVDGDRERERVDDVWSFANMNVLSVTAAPCQERTAC